MSREVAGNNTNPNGSAIVPLEKPSTDEESVEMRQQRRRGLLRASNILGIEEVFFRVFKYSPEEEKYILERHHARDNTDIRRYKLELTKDNRNPTKLTVEINDLRYGVHVVFPMTKDDTPPKFLKKYELPLKERLDGWTLERRMRLNNGMEETFYMHQTRTFRSFLDVAGFILYACEPRFLQQVAIQSRDLSMAQPSGRIPPSDAQPVEIKVEEIDATGVSSTSQT